VHCQGDDHHHDRYAERRRPAEAGADQNGKSGSLGTPYQYAIPLLVELPFARKGNKTGVLPGGGASPFTAAPLSRNKPA
jgi:hypothetical protein